MGDLHVLEYARSCRYTRCLILNVSDSTTKKKNSQKTTGLMKMWDISVNAVQSGVCFSPFLLVVECG